MFLLVFVRHVGAHPDELQHGVSIRSIKLGKTFPRISRLRIIPSTQILGTVFAYLPPFISQILDFICSKDLIFISIYFEWRDTENRRNILCFHSRGQHLCKFIGTKESVCIRKEFNSHRTGLGHKHGSRFIVLGHK